MKARLAEARRAGLEALRTIEAELGDIRKVESGVVIDLFLSYRAVKGWKKMIAVVEKMSRPLAATVMVQEQLALALNREGQSQRLSKSSPSGSIDAAAAVKRTVFLVASTKIGGRPR